MIIKYIDENGNFAQLETLVEPKWESRMEKMGNMYHAKRTTVAEKQPVKAVIVEVPVVTEEFDANAAKAYLKDKGVKGYQLLKGDSLKNKAAAEGFII